MALALTLLAPAAFAEEDAGAGDDVFATPGFYLYVGGATGIDVAAQDTLGGILVQAGVPLSFDVASAIGFNARLGARSGRWLASEAQVEYLPSFDVGALGITAVQYRIITVTGNLKLLLTRGRLKPYLLFGGGGSFGKVTSDFVPGLSSSGSGFAVRGGGGVELYVTPHVALVVDASYVYPTGDMSDLDYVSIGWGLQYKF